jgi:hypothetical protein
MWARMVRMAARASPARMAWAIWWWPRSERGGRPCVGAEGVQEGVQDGVVGRLTANA